MVSIDIFSTYTSIRKITDKAVCTVVTLLLYRIFFFMHKFSRCKFGQLGPGKGQFNSPHGFCLGNEEDIVVADTNNHRIQVFQKTGDFKYQFGIPGSTKANNFVHSIG